MEGMSMETEGTLYKTTHCKKCGMLFFAKPGSLNRFCDACGKNKVLQIKKLPPTLRRVNALKSVSAKS